VELTIFGKTLSLGFSDVDGNKERQTHTTIIQIPNATPRSSILKPNERNLRRFSRRAIPSRAISLIKDGVLAQKWKLTPLKKTEIPKQIYKAVENIILHPNETDDYRSFWGQILTETLIGDNGAAEIVFTGNSKQPMKLYAVNGFSLEHTHGFFSDPNFPRFVQKVNGVNEIYLYNKDVIYLQKNHTVDTPMGLSPLEAAFKHLDFLTDAELFASRHASNAFPKNALNLGEEVNKEDLLAYRKYFEEEIYGTGITPILGGTKGASSLKIGAEGDEELFIEWQKHLITIIALAFSIDPKKLGQGSNTDRSTVEEQNESLLNEGIRPYCLLLQDEINRKIISRLGLDGILKFEFYFEDTLDQKTKKQKLIQNQWESNALTWKEYRRLLDLEPLDSKYSDMTQAEMKSALNKEYAVQTGGFNGLGQNRKEETDVKETEATKDDTEREDKS